MHGLYEQQNLPYLTVKACPNCKELIPIEDEECPTCFYNFTSKETRIKKEEETIIQLDNTPETSTLDFGSPSTFSSQLKEEKKVTKADLITEQKEDKPIIKMIYCECCGSKIHPGQQYCGNCGARVNKTTCKTCGNIIESNLVFCPYCGNRQKEVNQPQIDAKEPIEEKTTMQEQTASMPIMTEKQIFTNEVEEIKAVTKDNKQENNDKSLDTSILNLPMDEKINMGRKRFLLILQMILLIFIGCIVLFIPLFTTSSFFESFIPSLKGEGGTFITGKDAMQSTIQLIGNFIKEHQWIKNFDSLLIQGENGQYLFHELPLIGSLFTMNRAYYFVAFFYDIVLLVILLAFILSFIGLFVKKPIKGTCLGSVTIILFLFGLVTYLNVLTPTFKNSDSFTVYVFVLAFLFYFMEKILCNKEAKLYIRIKKAKKIKSKSELDRKEII